MTFANILSKHLDKNQQSAAVPILSFMDYEKELAAKNKAIREFWVENRLPATPAPIIPSPLPRHYRTTTKRRVIRRKNDFLLTIVGEERHQPAKSINDNPYLLLEPKEHLDIYKFLSFAVNKPRFRNTATRLSYLIIRGNYQEFAVIFNIDRLDGDIVRALKRMAEDLHGWNKQILSVFAFIGPSQSKYYLDNQPLASGNTKIKKLFGHDKIFVDFGGSRYLFPPTVFSQVNHSMVSSMLVKAKELLAPTGSERLIDLYCGYGLFSLHLAPLVSHVIGLEGERESVASAIDNIKFHHCRSSIVFKTCHINATSLQSILPPIDNKLELLILDPPRQGVEPGVISILAERHPVRVLHICCGVDEIPRHIEEWRAQGYQIKKVVGLDMFAGTGNLEVMILMSR